MSRIRTIKPEFWSNEQVMECSLNARLLFIGLWNFSDDAGRHTLAFKQIKALIFPGDDIALETIRGWFDELSKNGLVVTYVVGEKEYFQITGWHHQRIDKPQPSKNPPPPDVIPGAFQEHSQGEGKGEDRKGEDTLTGRAAPKDVSREVAQPTEDRPDWWPKQDRYGRITSELTEKIVYDVGKAIIGKSAGGQITKLRKLYHGDLRAVTDLLMQAETKGSASEWIAGVIRKGELGERTSVSHEIYPETVYREAS